MFIFTISFLNIKKKIKKKKNNLKFFKNRIVFFEICIQFYASFKQLEASFLDKEDFIKCDSNKISILTSQNCLNGIVENVVNIEDNSNCLKEWKEIHNLNLDKIDSEIVKVSLFGTSF